MQGGGGCWHWGFFDVNLLRMQALVRCGKLCSHVPCDAACGEARLALFNKFRWVFEGGPGLCRWFPGGSGLHQSSALGLGAKKQSMGNCATRG